MKDHNIYTNLVNARTMLNTMIPTATNDKFRHMQLKISLATLNIIIATYDTGRNIRHHIMARNNQNSR